MSASTAALASRDRAASRRPAVETRAASGRPYSSPYVAGVGVGLVLLATFAITGRGLGASGAFSSAVTAAVSSVAPNHVAANASYAPYAGDATHGPLDDWLVLEVAGIIVGGFASAAAAGRLRARIERGPGTGRVTRLFSAMLGGSAMGLGAKLARGCTSGLGLSGGAVLSVGSWLFIICAFAAGYGAAPMIRRLWR